MQIHTGPVKAMRYNAAYDVVISTDAKGLLEYWSPYCHYGLPALKAGVKWDGLLR